MTAISEDDFQTRVMDYAKLQGWMRVHYRAARQGKTWVTPFSGDRGAPDLILARDGRVLLVELKSDIGKFRPGQREWLEAAGENGHLWRPADWPVVMEVLR